MMRPALRGALLLRLGVATLMCPAGPLLAAERRPVPAVTIYPGDILRDGMLTDTDVSDAAASYAATRPMLTGKVARRTLLPGQPIPATAVGEPRLITVGGRVRLVYQDGGLVVSTYASALQNGAVGDVITVRNLESGITVGGTVAPDGSVHVGADRDAG